MSLRSTTLLQRRSAASCIRTGVPKRLLIRCSTTFSACSICSSVQRLSIYPYQISKMHQIMFDTTGTLAITGNVMVLRIFGRYDSLRTPANMLIMNLAVADFLLMINSIPECVYNFFTGGPWRFGATACQIHAFTGTGSNMLNTNSSVLFSHATCP